MTPDAAGLRHGDRMWLRSRIHGGRDNRDIERNVARDARAIPADGRTSDRPGFNSTSSKVYASRGMSLEITAIANSA